MAGMQTIQCDEAPLCLRFVVSASAAAWVVGRSGRTATRLNSEFAPLASACLGARKFMFAYKAGYATMTPLMYEGRVLMSGDGIMALKAMLSTRNKLKHDCVVAEPQKRPGFQSAPTP